MKTSKGVFAYYVYRCLDAPSKTAPTSINFGDVPVGQSVRRALVIKNSSEHLAHYSFAADGGGTFAFDEVTGTVAGLLSKVVNIEFTPTESGNFYRRVTLLIQHQMPLFVDLLATAYTPKLRPEPLLQVHVDAQRHRARDGMAALSMPEMDAMIEAGQTLMHFVRANKTSVGTALEKRLNDDPQITRSGERSLFSLGRTRARHACERRRRVEVGACCA